jgi:lactoylglutathione lyase
MKKRIRILLPVLLQLFVIAGCDNSGDDNAASPGDASTHPDVTQSTDAGPSPDGSGADAGPGAVSYLGAEGLGVADLTKSLDFYQTTIGLTNQYSLSVPNYVDEDILYFKESPNTKYSDVVIGNYTYTDPTRPKKYTNNPVKLVFHVPNLQTMSDRITAKGLTVSTPAAAPEFGGAMVARATDVDGYTLELVEDTTITVPFLAAGGIGVSDLAKSTEFYTSVFGMQVKTAKISVPNLWDEVELEYPSGKGSNVLLMHYTDGKTHDYTNLSVKLVNYVPDSRVTAAAIEARGLKILSQPSVLNVLGTDARIALGTDPDGYTMEIVTVLGPDDGGLGDGAPGDGSPSDGSTEGGSSDGGAGDGGASDQ